MLVGGVGVGAVKQLGHAIFVTCRLCNIFMGGQYLVQVFFKSSNIRPGYLLDFSPMAVLARFLSSSGSFSFLDTAQPSNPTPVKKIMPVPKNNTGRGVISILGRCLNVNIIFVQNNEIKVRVRIACLTVVNFFVI